ncbi:MAG: regulatory protein RecX [Cyanobacteriota bacterium]|nr:regulatory protein RecX [Cyanobacteriota bacterium]
MTCLHYWLTCLGRRDYTRWELIQKAKQNNFTDTEIQEALEALQQQGYEPDTRYIISLIRQSRGQYGKQRLKTKCLSKGIQASLFDQIWEEQILESNLENSQNILNLKAKILRKYHLESLDQADPKTKVKIWNYLAYRGFQPAATWQTWQQISEKDEE